MTRIDALTDEYLYDALDLKPTEQKGPIVKRGHRFKLKLANFWTSRKVPIHKENVMRKSLFLITAPIGPTSPHRRGVARPRLRASAPVNAQRIL
jgi:hypothetical protein